MELVDLTGQQFGRLRVIGRAENLRGRVAWRCQCDCGSDFVATSTAMRSGNTLSCGCLRRDLLTKHGTFSRQHENYGKNKELYGIWSAMKDRCLNPNNKYYAGYGGRGIAVCDRWLNSFENFCHDMGARPSGMSIDRVNNDLGYEPLNCRWATFQQQLSNTRKSVYVEYKGRRITATECARLENIRPASLLKSLRGGPGDLITKIEKIRLAQRKPM